METAAVPDLWITLLKSCAMLCLVLGVLLLFPYAVKRLSGGRGGGGGEGHIRVLDAYPVSARERILLMEVMGERILVGVTSQSINCLAVIRGDRAVAPERPSPEREKGFFDLLKGKVRERQEREADDDKST